MYVNMKWCSDDSDIIEYRLLGGNHNDDSDNGELLRCDESINC